MTAQSQITSLTEIVNAQISEILENAVPQLLSGELQGRGLEVGVWPTTMACWRVMSRETAGEPVRLRMDADYTLSSSTPMGSPIHCARCLLSKSRDAFSRAERSGMAGSGGNVAGGNPPKGAHGSPAGGLRASRLCSPFSRRSAIRIGEPAQLECGRSARRSQEREHLGDHGRVVLSQSGLTLLYGEPSISTMLDTRCGLFVSVLAEPANDERAVYFVLVLDQLLPQGGLEPTPWGSR